MKAKNQKGFTIVELLLASTIFSMVMMVALSGFINIGRTFYKGINVTQTQQTARAVLESASRDISTSSVVSSTKTVASGDNRKYVCIGNTRYTFILSRQVDLADHDTTSKFGLLRDKLPGDTACGNPFDATSPAPFNNPEELLNNKMRLNSFCVTPASQTSFGKLYGLKVDLVLGDDGVLNQADNPSASSCSASRLYLCNTSLNYSQHCYRAELGTTVAGL